MGGGKEGRWLREIGLEGNVVRGGGKVESGLEGKVVGVGRKVGKGLDGSFLFILYCKVF